MIQLILINLIELFFNQFTSRALYEVFLSVEVVVFFIMQVISQIAHDCILLNWSLYNETYKNPGSSWPTLNVNSYITKFCKSSMCLQNKTQS